MTRPRGRPREFDPDEVLRVAMQQFLEHGYADTTVSGIAAAAGLNRPSLRAAFGDKRAIFLKVLARYGAQLQAALRSTLYSSPDLATCLEAFITRAVAVYTSGAPEHHGCLLANVAVVEAANDADVRGTLRESIVRLDTALAGRFQAAAKAGEISEEDAEVKGGLATALLHSVALRARSGESEEALLDYARRGVRVLCGAAPSR